MTNPFLARTLSMIVVTALCFGTGAEAQLLGRTETTEIAPNVYDFRYGNNHMIWVEMDSSVVVIDTFYAAAAAALKESIAAVTDKPVSHVIYSHEHYDHIKGAQVFADSGAEIISHANCLDTFEYSPNPDVVTPTMTFSGSQYEVPLPGTQIELLYLGRNHGDCMVFPHFPEHRIIMVVDILLENFLPWGSLPDYYPADMVRTLQELSELDFDHIARGHGGIVGHDVLADTLAYWSDLMTAVKAELDAGKRVDEFKDTLQLPQYRDWTNYDRWFSLQVERVAWYYTIGW